MDRGSTNSSSGVLLASSGLSSVETPKCSSIEQQNTSYSPPELGESSISPSPEMTTSKPPARGARPSPEMTTSTPPARGARLRGNADAAFPMYSEVKVHGVQNAPGCNGKCGIVMSELNLKDRQVVYIAGFSTVKKVNIKPQNLLAGGDFVGDLSIEDLKTVLEAKNIEYSKISETTDTLSTLQTVVRSVTNSPKEVALILVKE
eukprot:CAMPEP_0198156246 /NCGR_PEP_ID=MMETSP1443-20131203/69560_1 /TAXON_ID=186043 /ORGANISM="Entomoneis sp., Strain CCMP2396" /LENGTH=203 /DNA_ID=CAMNT_0043823035 /DNA_START=426 /DNA_END=1037 /DNA_ORIENTATION=-